MKILAIETSCDDTAVAVLEEKDGKLTALSNIVSSQTIHQNYGGVFPMMAKREHQKNMLPVFMEALTKSNLLIKKPKTLTEQEISTIQDILAKESELFDAIIEFLQTHEKPDIDYIAVTNGPGLEPCLWVGVNFARVLSFAWDIPLIPVNHIEAHILVNFINHKSYIINQVENFPAIALVVSGGHTQLILVKDIGDYKIIGETRDDAAGECFDKCARILGLGYPGGPKISAKATQYQLKANSHKLTLPRPMINSQDYDFSFSGLKTAVLYVDQKVEDKSEEYIQEMCFEVEQSIIDVLLKKTLSATQFHNAKTIILGGGVSANQELRKQLGEKIAQEIPNTKYLIPDTALSTDNALMIAVTGYFNQNPSTSPRVNKKASWESLEADANLRVGE